MMVARANAYTAKDSPLVNRTVTPISPPMTVSPKDSKADGTAGREVSRDFDL